MVQSDLGTRLNQAIVLLNVGRREEARAMLLTLSEQYPRIEQVWLWLIAATDDTEARVTYLRRVLELNPFNEKARAAYTQLTGEAAPVASTAGGSGEAGYDHLPSPASVRTIRSIESIVIGVLIFILIAVVVAVAVAVGFNALNPRPTQTPIPTETHAPTLTLTRTPSITPGGPTLTFIPGKTLPPTWTPAPSQTAAPSRTPLPTLTPLPSFTPSATVLIKPPTRIPTYTPGGPPLPTRTPQVTATGTLEPTTEGANGTTAAPTGDAGADTATPGPLAYLPSARG